MKVIVIKNINVETFDLEYPPYGADIVHMRGLNPTLVCNMDEVPYARDFQVEHISLTQFIDLKTGDRRWVGVSASARSDAPLIFETIEDMNKETDRLRKIKSEKLTRPEFKLDLTEWFKLQKRLQNA